MYIKGQSEQKKKNIPKAIFFDIDGTLVSFKTHCIPESAKKALELARAQGILLFAATGRHKLVLEESGWIKDLGFSGYVTLNGQYCYCGKQVIHANPIDRRDVETMLHYLETNDLACMFQEENNIYINKVDTLVETVHADIHTPIPPINETQRAMSHDIYQMCIYTMSDAPPPVLEQLHHCTYTKWHDGGIDIMPLSGNKWVGIQHMLAHFQLMPNEVAAFGDGANDLEMLAGVGMSVAMGNASDQVKSVSNFVTEDVDHDGVWSAIQYLL